MPDSQIYKKLKANKCFKEFDKLFLKLKPHILKKFRTEIKKFVKSKGWLSKKLSSSENYTDKVISVLEERSIWQRYGL